MATWKKVIVSGSDAELNTLQVGGGSGGSGVTVSTTGAVTADAAITAGSSFIIGSADMNEVDLEKLDGITNGTAAANKAVILDGSKNIATIGTIGSGAITSTGASTFGSISNASTVAASKITGSFSGSFVGTFDGADNLVDVTGTPSNNQVGTWTDANTMQGESNLTFDSTDLVVAGGGKVAFRDNGGEYIYSVSDNVLGLAAGSEIDLTATTIDINGLVDISGNLTVGGNLDVNGTVTTIDSTNLRVADRFIYASSGSTSGDGGLIIGTGAAGLGTAIGYDDSASRWALTKADETAENATSITPRQYVVSVSGSAVDASSNPSDFGSSATDRIGMMHVNTSTGDIFIFS